LRFFFARRNRKPFVLNTHGSLLGYKKYLPAGWPQLPYRLYDLLTCKRSALQADVVVVSSRFEFEDAVEFGIPRNKIRIIPAGVEENKFLDIESRSADGPLRLLFVGRVARVRRVELLLQAAQRLTIPWTAVIVGGEETTASVEKKGYLEELKRLCADLNIADRVTFTGAKHPDELHAFYRNADVFVYPSLYENFGQPLLEAAAGGLPIVATAVGLAQEIIEDGVTGFLVSPEPDIIRSKIEALADAKIRRDMGRRLQTLARNHYGWDALLQQYIAIYRSL
jgi:glycosyltransferase involved in cell wall biosynthesis